MQSSWINIERLPEKGAVRTIEEVAVMMGMTKQRVAVLEKTALRKLRNRMGAELRNLYDEAMRRDDGRDDAAMGPVRMKCFDEEDRG